VLVPSSGAPAARDVLLQTGLAATGHEPSRPPVWRVLAVLVAGVALIAVLAWLGVR
jgi:hypothetical protein